MRGNQYDRICKERFDGIEIEIRGNREIVNKLREKVFNGFGEQIDALRAMVIGLRGLVYTLIVAIGFTAVGLIVDIIIRLNRTVPK